MTILENLFYGNIIPCDKCFDRNSEYARDVEIVASCQKKLNDYFSSLQNAGEQQEWLDQLMDARCNAELTAETERFIEGFRLGVGIMLETVVAPRQSTFKDI